MKSLQQKKDVMVRSAFIAILCIVTLYSPFITKEGQQSIAIGTSVDEKYYAALIQKMAHNGRNAGSVSLAEHEFAPSTTSFAPVIQASILRYGKLSIDTTIAIGSIIFPLLTICFLSMACSRILQSRSAGPLTALSIGTAIGIGFLRPISPQVTLFFVSIYLWLLSQKQETVTQVCGRSMVIAGLLFTHIVTAPFVLGAEGWWRMNMLYKNGWKQEWKKMMALCIPLICTMTIKMWNGIHANPEIQTDVYRRLGLINSHLPANPFLQCIIIISIGSVYGIMLWKREKELSQEGQKIIALSIGLLLSLNQSLLHGIDIVFGLYAVFPAIIVLIILWSYNIQKICKHHQTLFIVLLSILGIYGMYNMEQQAVLIAKERVKWNEKHTEEKLILQEIQAWKPAQVILAPLALSNEIPLRSDHFVVFNQYAHYQWASDEELSKRYLLMESVFGQQKEKIDRTYPDIFGIAAGNSAARKRTMCKIRSYITRDVKECTENIRDHITHQELLPFLDRPDVNRTQLLKEFHVTTIISPSILPYDVQKLCNTQKGKIGKYTLWTCSTPSREQRTMTPSHGSL